MSVDLPLFEQTPKDSEPVTISQLNERIKFVLEDSFERVTVVGEIASFKHHTSGAFYFELKDESARISAVMFRNSAWSLDFVPQDGMKIVAEGKVTVFSKQGKYQIVVEKMREMGIGELMVKFRKLVDKLQREGLFDEVYKKPIPFLPKCVGVATSLSGAAIRDIVRILRGRSPKVKIVVRPTIVQGDKAPPDIVAAIKELDNHPGIDVMIVGRGGGSYEDLFVFNDEAVARAIFAARTPVISAVGHQNDYTIADMVADLRAATPTDAAQKVTTDVYDIIQTLDDRSDRLSDCIRNAARDARLRLDLMRRSLVLFAPSQRLSAMRRQTDDTAARFTAAINHLCRTCRNAMDLRRDSLYAMSPLNVLQRGYSIVRSDKGIVDSIAKVSVGDKIEVLLSKGSIGAEVLWATEIKDQRETQ